MAIKMNGLYLLVFGALTLACRVHCFEAQSDDNEENRFVNAQERLFRDFRNSTKPKSLPLRSKNEAVVVEFGFELINIVEVNAKGQFIKVYGWIMQKWNNSFLRWNPAHYEEIDTMIVSPNDIWVPDILLYNNIDVQDRVAGGRSTYKTDVTLTSNGRNIWNTPALFKLVCPIEVDYFPLDEQTCELKFGSWTESTERLQIQPLHLKFPSEYYTINGEWNVTKISLCRKRKKYQCCENMFDHVVMTIEMRRVTSDYLINLIIPCCLISSMIFLGFILPPESGERIGLSITVLLAMTVFQQLTSEIMPSYDFPILGQYYFAIVLEISTSIVATTLILNFYHRTQRKMPNLIRKVILHWTSRLVFLHDEVVKIYGNNINLSNEENRKKLEAKYDNKIKDPLRKSFRGSSRRGRKDGASGLEMDPYDKYSDINERYSTEQSTDTDPSQILYGLNVYPKINRSTMNGDTREGNTNRNEDKNDISEEEREFRKSEWTLAARILDRFVLVLSIVIGIITVGAVFLRAPVLWKHKTPLSDTNIVDIAKNCK